jgi:hypothetical protein
LCLAWRQATRDELGNLPLMMELQLGRQIALHLAATEDRS